MKRNETSIVTLSGKKLRQLKRDQQGPFQLILSESGETIICEEIVRIVPGKRLVAFAMWKNQLVVAKLFFDIGKSRIHCEREAQGIEALITSNIPTPALLFQGTSDKERIQVLLFERILTASNLDEVWQQKSLRPQLEPYMHALVYELATQHVHGIVQNDFHLKNFLICSLQPPQFDEIHVLDWLNENKIYILDGANIEKHDGILSKEKSLEHFGLFIAQLDVNTASLQKKLLQLYAHARGWTLTKADIDLFTISKRHWLFKRWSRYERKIMRNCTDFARVELFSALIMFDRKYYSPELVNLLNDPEEFFLADNVRILKEGNSSTVIKITIAQRHFVLKRYNIKGFWHGLSRAFRPSRAARAWKLGHLLKLFGIPTARPIAFVENRTFGIRRNSYLLMEYIDAPHIGKYFAHCNNDQLHAMVKSLMVVLTNLAKLRLTHGDLKMTNILIDKDCPILIDLDGMIQHHTTHSLERAFRKEFQRLLENWQNQPHVKTAFEKA